MHLPPSLGMGFGSEDVTGSAQQPGRSHQGLGLGLTFGSVGQPTSTSSRLSGAAPPWIRGHVSQQSSGGSTSSGQISGGSELGSASLRRLSTGDSFSFNSTNVNSMAGAGGMGFSLPSNDFLTAGSGLELGQMVKLSPTGRTTIPVSQSDIWYGGSPTRLNRPGGASSGFGLGMSMDDTSNSNCSFSGSTLNIMPFDRRGGDGSASSSTTLSAWGRPRHESMSNMLSLTSAGNGNNNCGPPQNVPQQQQQAQQPANASGTSIHIPNSTLSMMRYRESMGMMNMNNSNSGCGGQCQHVHNQQVMGPPAHQHYQRHDHHMQHGGSNCLSSGGGSHNNGRLGNHHRAGSNGNSNHQNHVDIEKIRRGQDVRTTVGTCAKCVASWIEG